jgi:hypothetical protein
MSLGFSRLTQALEPVRRALIDVYAADVLIFAAAHNEGGNQQIAFPASLDDVICVSSTNGLGIKSSFSPLDLPPGKRLCALGEGILCSVPKALSPPEISGQARKSGTSYATPIAAGIAARILEYMWPGDGEDDDYYFQKLRTKRGMLAVLQLMSMSGNGGSYSYIVPWKLFEGGSEHVRSTILLTLGLL